MMVAQMKMVVSRVMVTGMDSGWILKVEPRIGLWSVKGESRRCHHFWFEKVKSTKTVGGSGVGGWKIRN